MVKIVTDSVADIPPEIAQTLGITIVPLYVRFGTEVYRDRIDLSTREFYRKLVHGTVFPTTAAPSPGDFAQVYDRLAEETDEILSLHLVSNLSATFDAAIQGREIRKNNKCRVTVIDTQSAAMAQGLIVMTAAEAARAGKNLEQVTNVVNEAIPKVHLWGCFDTLEYLRRGGRIGRATALVGSILKINPIVTLRNSTVEPAGRERSRIKAIEHVYTLIEGFSGKIGKLAVEYADYGTTPQEAEAFARRLHPLLPPGERPYMSVLSPVMGAHTGPGTIIASVLEN